MYENKEGQRVPHVVFKTRQNNEWVDVSTDTIFTGRTVAVFSLPGAFTPTCSSAHVPRYNELAQAFRENGVDDVVCISVNDAFVMNAWQQDQTAENITFIPDGNGAFTAGMGMLVDKDDLGFGKRSWRYSMLVRDAVIEKMFIEPDVPGDPYGVSDADTLLDYLNPKAIKPLDVTVFTRVGCPHCARIKGMLREANMDYEEIVIGRDASLRALRAVSGAQSVPQLYVNGAHIGDSEAAATWLATRERD